MPALSGALQLLDADVDRAVVLFHDGHPSGALRLLRSVRRRADRAAEADSAGPGRDALVARTWMSESAPYFDTTGDLDGALEMLLRAELIARDVGSAPLLAKVRGQRALVVLRSGDTGAALQRFDEAAALIDDALPRDRAIIMLNRGVLHLEHSDLPHAASDLDRSVGYAEDAGDDRLASMARHNLGYVDFLAGRIPRALAAFEEAARTCPGGPHPAMQLDHARVLHEAGLVREADGILALAADRVRDERLFQDLGETELVRAECALGEGHARDAATLARAARRRFDRRGNQRWQRKAELLQLRADRALIEQRPSRERSLTDLADRSERLATSCSDEGLRELARSAGLLAAECRLRAGVAVPALPRVRAVDSLPTRLQVREVRALAALQEGAPRRALREVRLGLDELGGYQSGLGSLDLRVAGAVHGVALAHLGLGQALAGGSPGQVLSIVERSRALSTRLPLVRPPRDEVTARLLGDLRQAETTARDLEGDPGAAATALAAARSRASALRRDIRARAWELEGAAETGLRQAPRIGEVRAAARRQGSVFVTFARHDGRWWAVVVRPGGSELVRLAGTEEVAELVRRVRADLDALAMPHVPAALHQAVRSSVRSTLGRLDDLLLGPLRLTGRRLVLSCSGPLVVLPWGLLPSRRGVATVVTPGASTWLRAGAGEARPGRPRVAVLAGPDLHEAEQEAGRVRATWPGAALVVGSEATTAAARGMLASSDVLHVAAHGSHRTDNPLFSSVRLADGPLFAYELDAEAAISSCVTLSACEAGLATPRPGDEGLGLSHVLLQAGARSVVAGVARVSDDLSAATMERLHQGMAAGTDSATALAQALAASDEGTVPAPFVCFGSTW